MSDIITYSPEEVTVLVAGLIEIKGFVEGTFISVSRDVPLFSIKEYADGSSARIKNPSKTYSVELSLMSTSPSNDALSRLAIIDHLTYLAKFPLIIKDTLGSTLLFATTAWVEEMATAEFGIDVTQRTWKIKCPQTALFVGGNDGSSGFLEDILNTAGGLF